MENKKNHEDQLKINQILKNKIKKKQNHQKKPKRAGLCGLIRLFFNNKK
jgi:hypothetical protein